jgi:DNA-binding GntR family transcriptional regulator
MAKKAGKNTPNSNYLRVYEYLKKRIIDGTFDKDYVFVETEISEMLDVSRTPVREAIKMLKSERILTNVPKKGIMCRPLSYKDIDSVYEIAEAVEGAMAYNIASHSDELDFSELEMSLIQMEIAVAEHKIDEWIEADIEFHNNVKALCGNEFIVETINKLDLYIEIMRNRYTKKHYESMQHSTTQHRVTFDALTSGDAEYARITAQYHWRTIRKQLQLKDVL